MILKSRSVLEEAIMLLVQHGEEFELQDFFDCGRRCLKIVWPDHLEAEDVYPELLTWLNDREYIVTVDILVHRSHDNAQLIPRLGTLMQLIETTKECQLIAVNDQVRAQIKEMLDIQTVTLFKMNSVI